MNVSIGTVLRLLQLGVAFAVAAFVPFDVVLSIVGATVVQLNTFALPCLFHIIIAKPSACVVFVDSLIIG